MGDDDGDDDDEDEDLQGKWSAAWRSFFGVLSTATSFKSPGKATRSTARRGLLSVKADAKGNDAGNDSGDAADDGMTDEIGAHPKRRRRCSSDAATENAMSLIAKVEREMSWALHCNNRSRRRDFEAMCARLVSAGRKCGTFLSNELAMSTSGRCFALAEKLEARQAVFDDLRSDFSGLVLRPLPTKVATILREAPASLLATILTMSIQGMIDKCLSSPTIVQSGSYSFPIPTSGLATSVRPHLRSLAHDLGRLACLIDRAAQWVASVLLASRGGSHAIRNMILVRPSIDVLGGAPLVVWVCFRTRGYSLP